MAIGNMQGDRGLGGAWSGVLMAVLALWPLLAFGAGTPVSVRKFDTVSVLPRSTAPATVVSLNDSKVAAEVGGSVKAIAVKPGALVDPGEVLVKLECRDHELAARIPEAKLQAAEAELELANFRLQRADALREKGAIPLEEFQRRKAQALVAAASVRRLRAQVEQRRRAVEKCVVRAPFAAVVVERFASVGEMVSPGTPLLRLVDTQTIEVSSQVQEQDLDELRSGRQVYLVTRSTRYPLRIRGIVPVLDRRVSSYEVRFQFEGELPTPGQSGRVEWHATQPHVPAHLLVQRNGALGVFLAVGAKARFHPLKHARLGQPAPASLANDARIVVDGRFGLTDGQTISPVAR